MFRVLWSVLHIICVVLFIVPFFDYPIPGFVGNLVVFYWVFYFVILNVFCVLAMFMASFGEKELLGKMYEARKAKKAKISPAINWVMVFVFAATGSYGFAFSMLMLKFLGKITLAWIDVCAIERGLAEDE